MTVVECPSCNVAVEAVEWTVYRHGGGECPECGYGSVPKAAYREVEQ